MKLKFFGFLVVALLLVPFAHADQVSMEFTGVNGANDGHYFVSPYSGTMNGTAVVLFCDDILNNVSMWQTWTANVTNLGSHNFSNTRYGGVSSSKVYSNPALAYEEVAWLTTQFASHTSDYVSLQYAMWDIMNPGSEPTSYGHVQYWLNQAELNYGSINPNNFEIVTNIGKLNLTGQVQEFIVQTPEPSALALLGIGLLALGILLGRNRLLHA